MNQSEYDQSTSWLNVAPLPVKSLAEYSALVSAVKAQALFRVEFFALDISQLVGLTNQFTANRYERFERHLCLTSTTSVLTFHKVNIAGGGARVPFTYGQYGWYVDGVLRAITNVVPGSSSGTFNVVLGDEVDGIHKGQVLPMNVSMGTITECCVPFYFWIDRNNTAASVPFVIYQNDDFEWAHGIPTYHAWIAPKSVAVATAKPLPKNEAFEAFEAPLPKNYLSRIDLVPAMDEGNRFYPCITNRGITVTENEQGYFQDAYIRPYTYMPQIDGPRGIATVSHTTHLKWGRNNKLYGSSPVAWWVIDSTGTKRTLLGQRHKYAPYYADVTGPGHPAVETVGNWVGVPPAEQFPHKGWFALFDPATLAVDPNSPLVGGENTHTVNPTAYLGDAHGYVLRAEFDGKDRSVPPTITRHIQCDKRVFGGVERNGVLYLAEGTLNRISTWNLKTGQYLGDLLADPTANQVGAVNASLDTFQYAPGQSTTTARTHSIVCPEGLDIMDDWLYFGSLAQTQVRRINLVTKELQICCDLPISPYSSNVHFVNIAVSDGTFGSRHTIFTVHFDNSYFGRPRAWLPVASATRSHSTSWDWQYFGYDQVQGVGATGTLVGIYPMAVAVGQGGLAFGGTDESIQVFHKKDANELVPTGAQSQQMTKGHTKYMQQGLYLPYGRMLNGPLTYTKGQDLDIDVWAQFNGR